MIVAVVSGVISALSSCLTQQIVSDGAKLESAPSWYEKSQKSKVCGYATTKGGVDEAPQTKESAVSALKDKISNAVLLSAKENLPKVKSAQESELLRKYTVDDSLGDFVNKNGKVEDLEQVADRREGLFTKATEARVFASYCVQTDAILSYEQNRLEAIQKGLIHHRADKADSELSEQTER
jgi:hypothetical protein